MSCMQSFWVGRGYGRVNLSASGSSEGHRKGREQGSTQRKEILGKYHKKKGNSGRIPQKERTFWENTTQRKKILGEYHIKKRSLGEYHTKKRNNSRGGNFCLINFEKRKRKDHESLGTKGQCCLLYHLLPLPGLSKIIFSFPHDCLDTFHFQDSR